MLSGLENEGQEKTRQGWGRAGGEELPIVKCKRNPHYNRSHLEQWDQPHGVLFECSHLQEERECVPLGDNGVVGGSDPDSC